VAVAVAVERYAMARMPSVRTIAVVVAVALPTSAVRVCSYAVAAGGR
jgi:hypothetical protein